ncbi:uracil phosphoribosyltransferase [uncultured Clostridium sp.]|uniref:ComF family protein n=1 Tax=uncultured Clostridium sp. TaxID=59620 RepID=UPI0028E52F81|nr:uracil phosphoribosyltransferase [uncultured Clostridium sp.]
MIPFKNKIKNKKIILIDDVITTGATAYNCAKVLMDNGAKEINILTVAKSNV